MSQMSKRIRHAVMSKNPKKSENCKKEDLKVEKKRLIINISKFNLLKISYFPPLTTEAANQNEIIKSLAFS